MKVTSKKTISFSKLNWGINKGEERELPEDKEAQEIILAHKAISEVGKSKSQERREGIMKEEKTTPQVESVDKKKTN